MIQKMELQSESVDNGDCYQPCRLGQDDYGSWKTKSKQGLVYKNYSVGKSVSYS